MDEKIERSDSPKSQAEGVQDEAQQDSKHLPVRESKLELATSTAEHHLDDEDSQAYTIFTPNQKLAIVIAVSLSSIISPLGATTFYPSIDIIAENYHTTPARINLSLTTYQIAQAISPALIAAASDSYGRRLSYLLCFVIFIGANIGLGLQDSYATLLVLRVLQATGCSAAIALAYAVVADIATPDERGSFVGYATAGLLLGPAFGPTIGGLLGQYLGWRSTFWFLAIYGGVLLVIFALFFPETCRAVVGNGSIPAAGLNRSILGHYAQRNWERTHGPPLPLPPQPKKPFPLNPIATLRIWADPESAALLLYNGLFFAGMMMMSSSLPTLYKNAYHLNQLDTGLCYISWGCGSLCCSLVMGPIADRNFRRYCTLHGLTSRPRDLSGFPIEKARLQVVVPGHIIGVAAFLLWGWSVDYALYLAVPEIALFFIGFGVSTAFNLTSTLIVDLHKKEPATATAAVNLARSLLSAGGAAAILPMCAKLGVGWAWTFWSCVFAVLLSVVFGLMRWGMGLRERKRVSKRERG